MRNEGPILILQTPGQDDRRWLLNRDIISIGRRKDNDIVLPDRQVSRLHARIERQGDRYVLHDCGSKNGTFVNGHPVVAPQPLTDGDEIQIALGFKLFFVGAEATAPLFRYPHRRIELNERSKQVWVAGQELQPPLSSAQYRLLHLLHRNAGNVCSRDEIVQAVWPETGGVGVTPQAIDALVRRLRDRIKELDPNHEYIVTVRGHGFRLEAG